eukprot:15468251-Alexandrium_andersonii.AAC.2
MVNDKGCASACGALLFIDARVHLCVRVPIYSCDCARARVCARSASVCVCVCVRARVPACVCREHVRNVDKRVAQSFSAG